MGFFLKRNQSRRGKSPNTQPSFNYSRNYSRPFLSVRSASTDSTNLDQKYLGKKNYSKFQNPWTSPVLLPSAPAQSYLWILELLKIISSRHLERNPIFTFLFLLNVWTASLNKFTYIHVTLAVNVYQELSLCQAIFFLMPEVVLLTYFTDKKNEQKS